MNTSEIPGKLPHMMMSSHVKIHCINKLLYLHSVKIAWSRLLLMLNTKSNFWQGKATICYSIGVYIINRMRSLLKYMSTLEAKFCISAPPCNILYLDFDCFVRVHDFLKCFSPSFYSSPFSLLSACSNN